MFEVMESVQSRELCPAIQAFRNDVLPDLPDALAEEDFAELWRASELLELEKLRRLADLERRGVFARDGHLSVAAWLASRFGVARGAAVGAAKTARALEEMPATTAAVEAGRVSLSAARALVSARDVDPEVFARDEGVLVDAARIHPVADLQRVTTLWRQRVERERGLDPEATLMERRNLHVSRTFEGMVRVDGDLMPDGGEALLTAVTAVVDAGARTDREDRRTPAQRRADAIGEICPRWRASAPTSRSPSTCGTWWAIRPRALVPEPPSSTMRVRCLWRSPGDWPATPRSRAWCWPVRPSRSTSAVAPRSCPPPSDAP